MAAAAGGSKESQSTIPLAEFLDLKGKKQRSHHLQSEQRVVLSDLDVDSFNKDVLHGEHEIKVEGGIQSQRFIAWILSVLPKDVQIIFDGTFSAKLVDSSGPHGILITAIGTVSIYISPTR